MYCKHCYRMMDDGMDTCPACGKSQNEKVKKTISKPLRILLGIAVWFGTMIALAIVGTALGLANSDGILSGVYSLSVVIIPVVVAVKVTSGKQAKPSAPTVSKPQQALDSADEIRPAHSTASATAPQPISVEPPVKPNPAPAAAPQPRPSVKSTTHHVTGINYYMDNIMSLASENPDYDMTKKEIIEEDMIDERIWKYDFDDVNVKLVPEPDNPHDPNAIMVLVGGKQVGYIKAGSCSKVLKLISSGKIRGIDCTIGGGPYKIVYEEYDEDRDRDVYTLERDETNYSVKVTIYESLE